MSDILMGVDIKQPATGEMAAIAFVQLVNAWNRKHPDERFVASIRRGPDVVEGVLTIDLRAAPDYHATFDTYVPRAMNG